MDTAQILLLAAALSIDALGIGMSCRLKGICLPAGSRLMVTLLSAILTGAAVAAGGWIGGSMADYVTEVIGSALLLLLGLAIILGAVRERYGVQKRQSRSPIRRTVHILTDPSSGDLDHSRRIELKEAVYMGAALSADSAAAGFGIGTDGVLLPVFCCLFQFLFLWLGEIAALSVQKRHIFKDDTMSMVSGGIILLLGILRFPRLV